MKKRGQITVFLIVGVVVILVGVLIFYLMQDKTKIDEPTLPLRPQVPLQSTPVYNLIEQCMHDLTEKALKNAMLKGGYIYGNGLYSHPIYSTEGNAIELVPTSDILIPFWYYMESNNECTSNCRFNSMRKPLCKNSNLDCDWRGENSIEKEIETYLKNNLNICINDFFEIEKTGVKVNELEEPNFEVIIRKNSIPGSYSSENSILVNLKFPLEIINQNEIFQLSEFMIQRPTFIYELYEVAYEIAKYQEEYCFLDEHLLNIISLHSGLNDQPLPPFSASTNNPLSLTWIKRDVKKNLDQLTNAYIPLIRLFNTSVEPFPEVSRGSPLMQGIIDSFLYYPLTEFRNVFPSFIYYSWHDTYFDIYPNKGELIGPSEVFNPRDNPLLRMLGNIQFKEYEFYYRYSYPIIVELRKFGRDYSFEGMELFRFALEGNIRSNKCFTSEANIVGIGGVPSLLCDPLFYVNQNFSFTLINDYTDELIENVEVDYFAEDTCPLGLTDYNGNIITKIPSSEQGLLIFRKEGYLDKIISKDDLLEENIIRLSPLFEHNISIKRINFDLLNQLSQVSNLNYYKSHEGKDITENMSVLIQIERYKQNEFDADYSQIVYLDYGDNKTLFLTKGLYNIDIILILNEEITLPEEKNMICIDTSVISFRSACRKVPINDSCYRPEYCDPWPTDEELDDQCFSESDCYKYGFTCSARCNEEAEIIFDEQNLSSIILGGLMINQTNTLWSINNYDLLNNSETLEFYVFDQGVPERLTHLFEEMGTYIDYSMYYGNYLRPYFK